MFPALKYNNMSHLGMELRNLKRKKIFSETLQIEFKNK
jgi:hypothetical protein